VTLCRYFFRALPDPCREDSMNSYRIAGIDVHKKMLAVVITDIGAEGELAFERRKFGTTPEQLRLMTEWMAGNDIQSAVMESTAQYWKPVWLALEGKCELHLAQAYSNRAPKGRKRDFQDAERLVRRLVAGELVLSFVPDREQRLWRTLTHAKHQLTREKIRALNQLEAFLEDARIKLSSFVSALKGVSSRRILKALSQGETDAGKLAWLADPGLKATEEQLRDALSEAATLDPCYRAVLDVFLTRIDSAEQHIEKLEKLIAERLRQHNDAVVRLAEIPGLGADSAWQIVAEVGPEAATFNSPDQLASWIGVCPGREESAEVSRSNRSPKGNRPMRRILNQAANAALKAKGSVFQLLYQRMVGRLGHKKAVWAVAHRIARIVWKVLHDHVRYDEKGMRSNPAAARKRASRLVSQLRRMGYNVQIIAVTSEAAA
jgi:transposase